MGHAAVHSHSHGTISRARRLLALVLALGTLLLALWIVLPAPTYFFITYSVGAVEVSAWLILASLAAFALGGDPLRSVPDSARTGFRAHPLMTQVTMVTQPSITAASGVAFVLQADTSIRRAPIGSTSRTSRRS